MPETLRSPNLSHKPVPYTVICHKEEDEEGDDEELSWSDEENARKNLTNVKDERFVAVKGNGLEKTLMANLEEKQDVDKFQKQKDVFHKNGLRVHQRRTMEVKEVQKQAAETVL